MKHLKSLLTISIVLLLTSCEAQIPDKAIQIKTAEAAAPEGKGSEATILGYDKDGKVVTLREGSNEFVCLADDLTKDGFSSACYHKDLEPFMARGRELRAQGKSRAEIFTTREMEAKAGKLQMPENPTTLHVLSGSNGKYDEEKGKVVGANYRYVVYIPFATAESTGLPTKPLVPGGPWIMDPGTHKAHIMITPPAPKK